MSTGTHIIPLFAALPLMGAFLIPFFKKTKHIPEIIGNIAAGSLCVLSVAAVFLVNTSGIMVYSVGAWQPPIGIALVLDGLSSFMLVTVNLVAFLIALYAIQYMRKFTAQWKFYTLLLLMIAGMNGVVITGDIFNLFVFLEIASVASYALVAFGTEKHELEAAFKYAVMSTVGSLFILIGIVFLYSHTSTLNMADIGTFIASEKHCTIGLLVSALFIMGFGLKAALVPFHAWLPDAHPSAPAPISAMLSGVLIKSLGVYSLFRILFNVIGMNTRLSEIILVLGALSMVIGVFLAIGQWDFKRLLAYHSISQIGYVVLGIGLGTPLGIAGGLFHLLNHSLFKSLLFLNSGAVEYASNTRDLREMGGFRTKMPVTASTGFVASMSIAGIPPFNGFWSKLMIIIAAVQAGRNWYAFWAVLASILTLASFMKVMKYAFAGSLKDRWKNLTEVPFFMKISMILLALLCIFGGLVLLDGPRQIFLDNAAQVLAAGSAHAFEVLKSVP
ncbi:MAG: NADH/ubiquinone/plastoquinone (complex I) [Elusimicrobia bacterium]|nr:NADH/ubiquinone/plastoquinone (complex I) [Elusimicrobiota bacterium]MBD3411588.1 NADH/ubiquinone/plastoquinone (complex I) [Elusimicrobiota bacterium]